MIGKSATILSCRSFVFAGALLAIVSLAAVACISAAPSECIAAAEEAGLPGAVIEQLRNPGDLNAIERAALNRILSEAGIDDLCEVASDAADSGDVPNIPRSDDSGTENDDKSDEPEKAEGGVAAIKQTIASPSSARVPVDDEYRRRCRFWALNNLQPIVFNEFSKLNPDNMDDLDRILWRSKLNPENSLGYYKARVRGSNYIMLYSGDSATYCRDYWAEPLNRVNAELRNHGYEGSCRFRLAQRIEHQYNHMAETTKYREYEDKELVFQIPNQYVRILQWIDLSADELLDSDNPPYRILQEQSEHLYAYIDSSHELPREEDVDRYRRENGDRLNLEWLSILAATALAGDPSDLRECHYYYPQVFYGYWVPFNPDRTVDRNSNQGQEVDLPEYSASETPLYLPKTVTADRVRAGYPLGEAAEQYHLCRDSSETENIGYYYVNHPAGDYCEKMP